MGNPGAGEATTQNHTGEPGLTCDHTGARQAAGALAEPEPQGEPREARTAPEANREETRQCGQGKPLLL